MNKLKHTFTACIILLCALILNPFKGLGQTITKGIQIHFATANYVLTKEHKREIMNLLDSVPKDDSDVQIQINRVVVNGHTDNEGDSAYNLKLSEKRADAVMSYLAEKGVDIGLLKKSYYGEKKPVVPNLDSQTKLVNRRVDISVTYTIIKKGEQLAATERCQHDTMIMLASGTRVSMSICDYERMGGEFQVKEVLNGQSVRESGLNTMGDDGTPLMSGGMFNFKFKNDSCLKKPVTIRVPVDTCIKQPKKMMKYVYNYNNGRWTRTRVHIHVVKVNKQQFYEFAVQCPGLINIDYPRYFVHSDLRQFYAKNGLTIVKLKISNDCPCSMLEAVIRGGGKRAFGWVSGNQREPLVSAIAVDKNGDTLTMQYKPLSSLQGKGEKSVTGHLMWVFPVRSKLYYDKYVIRKSDFDPPATAKK